MERSENLIVDATEAPCPSAHLAGHPGTHRTLTNAQGDMPSSPKENAEAPASPTPSVEELALVAMLQKQLKAAGVDPKLHCYLWTTSRRICRHTRKLMAGDERAQSDFDKWEKSLARIRTILKPLNVLRRSGRKHSAPGTQPRCHICVSFS